MSNSSTWLSWHAMIQRCENHKNKNYIRYGGRGIRVCKRWRRSFIKFLADMGEKPKGKTLDRIDNDGDYRPSNCRWATSRTQANNTRRNRYLTYKGKTRTIAQWSIIKGIKYKTLHTRLQRDWTVEDTLTIPVRKINYEHRKSG